MATKRTPIKREMRRRISAEAIEAYRRMRNATLSTDPDHENGEWWNAQWDLRKALGLMPWQHPAIWPHDVPQEPLNSSAGSQWTHSAEHNELRDVLEEQLALTEFGEPRGD